MLNRARLLRNLREPEAKRSVGPTLRHWSDKERVTPFHNLFRFGRQSFQPSLVLGDGGVEGAVTLRSYLTLRKTCFQIFERDVDSLRRVLLYLNHHDNRW